MGTWALPQTVKQAKDLQKLMEKPLSSAEAADKLYHLLGDDELFDNIGAAKEKGKTDVRNLVAKSLKQMISEKDLATEPWKDEPLKICKSICKTKFTG